MLTNFLNKNLMLNNKKITEKEYNEALNTELKIIGKKENSNYIVTQEDVINHLKERRKALGRT